MSPKMGPARVMLISVTITMTVVPLFPTPAKACSCAVPSDIIEWVDQSEAAFVGTLIDKADAGRGEFGDESIYRFEVEQWVKGSAGDVIEVRSASDGGGCGFEFFGSDRIGAVLYLENGELTGGLCSQIDADVLLAAMAGPTPSDTGIGHLLLGNGWSSTRLTVLDNVGATVTILEPPTDAGELIGTQGLRPCPGGDMMLQWTQADLIVWDLNTLEPVTTHDLSSMSGPGWVSDVSCREQDASSIWLIVGGEFSSRLIELVPELSTLLELDGNTGHIGTDFIISQRDPEGDATWVDIETGDETRLTETPPNELRSISVAPHPSEQKVAVLETRFSTRESVAAATLSIVDSTGATVESFDIPHEAYSPLWLDDDRLIVTAYNFDDWGESYGYVFDLGADQEVVIDGWNAQYTIADGGTLYGVRGGDVLTADLSTGSWERLVTLPTQAAGPIIRLHDVPTLTPATTTQPQAGPTTPPLVAPPLEAEGINPVMQWIAGIALATFVGTLAWLIRRPAGERESLDQV